MSDEEVIAIAVLHGLVCHEGGILSMKLWYLGKEGDAHDHEIELNHHDQTGWYGFESLAGLARAYCTHYNILEPAE